ncbi:MAG: hypothetical protein WBP45_07920 [Daejeonella sp.]
MAKSNHYYIRKAHRWLGVILGIQFLMWTIGGLYFSWTDIDDVHGDFQKRNIPLLSSDIALVSPSLVLNSIKKTHQVDSVVSIQLIEILGKPFYQIRCISAIHNKSARQHEMHMMNHLADAVSGELRTALTKAEAVEIAKMRFNGDPKVKAIEYLTTTNSHHEYRESPLPAYAITFEHPTQTTVYVATELGTVQKFRNNKWRVFDFLWMLHTMDFEGRDNFGNTLLKIFSIFGLFTVLSGFLLFFISYKKKKNIRVR